MNDDHLLVAALAEIQAGRRRERLFGSELTLNVAWDLLLHLFVRQTAGGSFDVDGLERASAAPTSTILRYLDALAQLGWVDQQRAGGDGEGSVVLTERGRTAMRDYFVGAV
jgi:hypothetical protein